jgi:hypothetical protein
MPRQFSLRSLLIWVAICAVLIAAFGRGFSLSIDGRGWGVTLVWWLPIGNAREFCWVYVATGEWVIVDVSTDGDRRPRLLERK